MPGGDRPGALRREHPPDVVPATGNKTEKPNALCRFSQKATCGKKRSFLLPICFPSVLLSRNTPRTGPALPENPGTIEHPLSLEALHADFRLAIDRILQGDSIEVMRRFPAESVNLVITDPPYLVDYRERAGRRVTNDSPAAGDWLEPSTREIYRVLKPDRFFSLFLGLAPDRPLHDYLETGGLPPGQPSRLDETPSLENRLHRRPP